MNSRFLRCSHCQRAVDLYKQAAEKADAQGIDVEFAAINCVLEGTICNEWFGIRAYPTFLAVNDFHGT
jgi:thiol-disulfide isomerase/thioredoxin